MAFRILHHFSITAATLKLSLGVVLLLGAAHAKETNQVGSLEGRWAFQPVRVPQAGETIDGWITDALGKSGITPVARASAEIRLRRLKFTLTGLPPTVDEQEQLAREESAGTVEKWLLGKRDTWLRSAQFGEGWARHWMDVVRFAESKGHEYDYEIQGAWRYRDYLIRAFQQDVPWPQMVKEHLMGDFLETPRQDPATGENESLLATLWWNLGESSASPTDLPNDEGDRIDGPIDVLGKAFQGLTFGCARCHDHKLDPISHKDYTALYGIVASTPLHRSWHPRAAMVRQAAALTADREKLPLPARQVGSVAYVLGKKHQLLADFSTDLPPQWMADGFWETVSPQSTSERQVAPGFWSGLLARQLPASLRSPTFVISTDYLDVLCRGEDSTLLVSIANMQIIRDPIYDRLRKNIDHGWQWKRFPVGRWKGQRAYVEAFTGQTDPPLMTKATVQQFFAVRAVVQSNGEQPSLNVSGDHDLPAPPEASKALTLPEAFLTVAEPSQGQDVALHFRGDANKPRDIVPRGYLEPLQPLVGGEKVAQGSGRRELTEAILHPKNPLTARVWVNRVWHWCFGRGLVASPDDFGKLGASPTHPELLDLLAWRFVNVHQGSLHALLREILGTEVWQRAGRAEPMAQDPENKLLGHFPLRRLEAEAIRDSLLAVSGRLEAKVGGPSVASRPRGQFFTNVIDWKEEGTVDGEGRRSLYLRTRRNYPDAFLALFDKPAPVTSFGQRNLTQSPAQALVLLNDPLPALAAQHWGAAMAQADGTPAEKGAHMVQAALGRPAQQPDLAAAAEWLGEAPTHEDFARYAVALFNLKEFIHVE